jgi:hypothetical protein
LLDKQTWMANVGANLLRILLALQAICKCFREPDVGELGVAIGRPWLVGALFGEQEVGLINVTEQVGG